MADTTLRDIADELNVDISTVSKALNDHPKISDTTKLRVTKAAKELNYHQNKIAAALVKGASNLIGVMVPQTDEIFFSSIIRGIEEVVKNSGYNIIILQSNDQIEDEIENINILFQTKVDGILVSHAMETQQFDHYRQIIDRDIPFIFVDRYNTSLDTGVVAIDDFKGAYKAVSHLIDQGCRRIAHIAGRKHVHIYKERFRGYKQALQDHDLSFRDDMVVESNLKLEAGRTIARKFLKMDPRPDALFAAGDRVAMGAIQELKKQNISIPSEMALVGFSNEDFCSFVTPTLTSIDQHSRKMGQKSAKLLVEQLSNDENKKISQKTLLNPELIIRESSLQSQSGENNETF